MKPISAQLFSVVDSVVAIVLVYNMLHQVQTLPPPVRSTPSRTPSSPSPPPSWPLHPPPASHLAAPPRLRRFLPNLRRLLPGLRLYLWSPSPRRWCALSLGWNFWWIFIRGFELGIEEISFGRSLLVYPWTFLWWFLNKSTFKSLGFVVSLNSFFS
jgi:hypothetical protein